VSRAYDAQAAALKAYPDQDQLNDAVDLFLEIIDISDDDFKYQFNMSPEEYLNSFRGK